MFLADSRFVRKLLVYAVGSKTQQTHAQEVFARCLRPAPPLRISTEMLAGRTTDFFRLLVVNAYLSGCHNYQRIGLVRNSASSCSSSRVLALPYFCRSCQSSAACCPRSHAARSSGVRSSQLHQRPRLLSATDCLIIPTSIFIAKNCLIG